MLDKAAHEHVSVMNCSENHFTASEESIQTGLRGGMVITRTPCGWRCHRCRQLSLLCKHFSKAALQCSLHVYHSYSDMWRLA